MGLCARPIRGPGRSGMSVPGNERKGFPLMFDFIIIVAVFFGLLFSTSLMGLIQTA